MTLVEPTGAEMRHLERAVELAAEALRAGDEPFGSVLVGADGQALAEDRNRVRTLGDNTRHPEFELVRWATARLTARQRAEATVFTSGEHCPMCAAAHGWAGLGRIVYVHSAAQLTDWLAELGVAPSPVRCLPIQDVVPGLTVQGPVPALTGRMRELHTDFHTGRPDRTAP
ncbi:nucleoside deaminase [Streptomyces nodosus]|uniref:Cytidine deaminase n=1 Tax=Streptomyces nodosus TaxID=40318 RepID=A0A0B5DCF8_9ACTN|nr:nucleoside deaminase [Streptomyces nodosus]AJE41273.1 cytidine deaminase [Streptomyces nodosus]MBB4792435.1 tRNA(Arg) A34 adenosine deaminase TadA [Streptomyces nodosus]QEV39813.1 nucleoside deaminase [Streptomyces nodosus]